MVRRGSVACAAGATLALALAACAGDVEDSVVSVGDEGAVVARGGPGGPPTSQDGTPGSPAGGQPAGPAVGVLLAGSTYAGGWERTERPVLEAAFAEAGIELHVHSARGSRQGFLDGGQELLDLGVDVLLVRSRSLIAGGEVISRARAAGVPVVDYGRLTIGGGADYHVAFDSVSVGSTLGEGLVQCLDDAGVTSGDVVLVNGDPEDRTAELVRHGYQSAVAAAGFGIADDQYVEGWDANAATSVFDQVVDDTDGDFVAVAAANDGLAGAVIDVLDTDGLAGEVPVAGQNATVRGLRRVLDGTQCTTVYKPAEVQAEAAAELAVALVRGDDDAVEALASGSVEDRELGMSIPAVLIDPVLVFRDDVPDLVAAGAVSADALCVAATEDACAELGIT